jgi:predicted MFS family arabinose efflux permease
MQAGMLLGRSAFGGGALIARRHFGEQAVILLLLAVSCVTLVSTTCFRDTWSLSAGVSGVARRLAGFRAHVRAALSRRSLWFGLAFAATGGAAFEAVGALAGPFLIDRGQTSEAVGWFFALPTVACMLAGALLGGYASDRIGKKPVLVAAGAWIAAVVFLLALLDGPLSMHQPAAMLGCLALMYFGIGLFTASSYALFMDMTDPDLGSTQFSAFMGATNLCEAWAALCAGKIVAAAGYPTAFTVMGLAAVVALALVAGMRAHVRATAVGADPDG